MNWDYLAGFIDGEGGLFISWCWNKAKTSGTYVVRMSITNLNKDVMDSVAEFLESEDVHFKYNQKLCSSNGSPTRYDIYVNGHYISKVLDNVSDKLIAKCEQAKVVREYISTIVNPGECIPEDARERREYLYEYLCWLNSGCP